MKNIDIVERIEGEAKLVCSWKDNIISDARVEFLNFRGFEYILKNKDPLDALVYTPRICGICGQAHLKATVEVLEEVYKSINEPVTLTNKAKLIREIALNIEIIDSHIKWFYMVIMPDIAKLSKEDKYEKYSALKGEQWFKSSKVASETIKALALVAGQWPHSSFMVPGGVMCDPTLLDLRTMQNYLEQAMIFFEKNISGVEFEKYLSFSSLNDLDLLTEDLKDLKKISFDNELHKLGRSYNRFLSLGNSSLFDSGKIKAKNIIKVDSKKVVELDDYSFKVNQNRTEDEFTWAKTALYSNEYYETGPLARALISNRRFIKELHKEYKDSAFVRIFARMDELAHLLFNTKELISKVDISEESFIKPKINLSDIKSAQGTSVTEATRGSLYHKIEIEHGKIKEYDIITPTVWNLGPGMKNRKGVAQKAIIGSKSIEQARIILRSYDVCSVCTTH